MQAEQIAIIRLHSRCANYFALGESSACLPASHNLFFVASGRLQYHHLRLSLQCYLLSACDG